QMPLLTSSPSVRTNSAPLHMLDNAGGGEACCQRTDFNPDVIGDFVANANVLSRPLAALDHQGWIQSLDEVRRFKFVEHNDLIDVAQGFQDPLPVGLAVNRSFRALQCLNRTV